MNDFVGNEFEVLQGDFCFEFCFEGDGGVVCVYVRFLCFVLGAFDDY